MAQKENAAHLINKEETGSSALECKQISALYFLFFSQLYFFHYYEYFYLY